MVLRRYERIPVGDASQRLKAATGRLRTPLARTSHGGLLAAVLLTAAAPVSGQAVPCDAAGADPWVVSLRDRVLRFDDLAAFAVEKWGDPVGCEGEVTMDFDGARYGVLRLDFEDGVALSVETQPIETSIVTLGRTAGFADPEAVAAALRSYTTEVGVSIDWEDPETLTQGEEESQVFRDPTPGLNASAALVTRGGMLVRVRFSMAL